jgi:hypothetical protein
MSLEAAAGKNPVSHVGKINVLARRIAEAIVASAPEVREVHPYPVPVTKESRTHAEIALALRALSAFQVQ